MRRATVKIERAVGEAGTTAPSPERSSEEEATTATVQQALTAGRAMRIRYYTASRDAVSQRTIDPMRLLIVSGRGYLEAWCRRVEAVRLFRLDRVEDVTVLDEPAAPPPEAEPTDLSAGCSSPRPSTAGRCWCSAPDAHWVAEYYPVDEIDKIGDPAGEAIRVVMRYADPAWLVRLVLGLGGTARVVEPPELAAAVLRAGAAGYGASSAGRARDGMRGTGMERRGGGVGVARAGCAGDGRARRCCWAGTCGGWAGCGQAWRPTSRRGWRGCGSWRRAAPGRAAAAGRPRKLTRKSGRDDADRRGKGVAMGSLGGWEIVILLVVVVAALRREAAAGHGALDRPVRPRVQG